MDQVEVQFKHAWINDVFKLRQECSHLYLSKLLKMGLDQVESQDTLSPPAVVSFD